MPHIICAPCHAMKSGACAAVCPVDCIEERADQYAINPKLCIDCGACTQVCPVEAIYYIDAVPAEWTGYIEKNANYFT